MQLMAHYEDECYLFMCIHYILKLWLYEFYTPKGLDSSKDVSNLRTFTFFKNVSAWSVIGPLTFSDIYKILHNVALYVLMSVSAS